MSAYELFALLLAVLVFWIVLKVAKFAVKVIFIILSIIVVAGALWLFFPR